MRRYSVEQIAEMAKAEKRARNNAARFGGCTLGEVRSCDQARTVSCRGCGWNAREAERRALLPLRAGRFGLLRKAVGIAQPEE